MAGNGTPRGQGDRGELSAMCWLVEQGACVSRPLLHSPDYDLVADFDGRLARVEVKTSCSRRNGRWAVLISTRGGNRSWSGLVKYFDPERCDFLFIHVGDGRRWFIPTWAVEGRTGLSLGGPKYSQFEVQPGAPLEPAHYNRTPPGEYRSGQPGRAVNALALPTQVRILPPPSIESSSSAAAPPLAASETRIWPKHRITLPRRPFEAAGLEVGDRLVVEALGPGRLAVRRASGTS